MVEEPVKKWQNVDGGNTLVSYILVSITVYTRVQVERMYKSNPIFEAKNTTFLEKV